MHWRLLAPGLLAALLATGVTPAVQAENAECMAWCARADAECSASARDSKKTCARQAATAGVNPMTRQRDNGAYLCGWFRGNNCSGPWAGANCAERQRARLDVCLDAYAPNTAAEYLACNDGERREQALCREEFADCQAQCR